MPLLWLLLACADEPPCPEGYVKDGVSGLCLQEQVDCPTGFLRDNDGNCVQVAAAPTEPPDTGTPVRPPGLIDDSVLRCDGPWQITVETTGGADRWLYNHWSVLGGGYGWDEEHPATAAGQPVLSLSLLTDAEPTSFVPGATTAFSCGVQDLAASTVYAVRIYNDAGVLTDCVMVGDDWKVAQVQDGDPEVTNWNGVTAADELAGCRHLE